MESILETYQKWFSYAMQSTNSLQEVDMHLRHIGICVREDLADGYIILNSAEHKALRDLYIQACKKKKEMQNAKIN